jgi:glutathione S-transferase
MSLKLYFAPGLCAFAPLIALEEAGATYAAASDAGVRRAAAPGILALNTRGQVPVMEVDGQIVRELPRCFGR